MVNLVGPQQLRIGGEANGEAEVTGDSVEDARQELVDGLQAETGEVVLEVDLGHRTLTHWRVTHWHVTAAGCEAI